jgi:hypothetical protein
LYGSYMGGIVEDPVTLSGREEPAGGRYRLHQLVTTQNSLPIFLINAVGPSSRHPGPSG